MRKQQYTYIKNSDVEKPKFLFSEQKKGDDEDARVRAQQEKDLEEHIKVVTKIQNSMPQRN